VERGPQGGRHLFGAVPLGSHPDGTLVVAVEEALDRIVARNIQVLGGGRVRQLIVDRELLRRWDTKSDLLDDLPPDVIELVPRELALAKRLVPIRLRRGKVLIVAV